MGNIGLRVICHFRTPGNETRCHRGSEQVTEMDKEGGRKIVHFELTHVLDIIIIVVVMILISFTNRRKFEMAQNTLFSIAKLVS